MSQLPEPLAAAVYTVDKLTDEDRARLLLNRCLATLDEMKKERERPCLLTMVVNELVRDVERLKKSDVRNMLTIEAMRQELTKEQNEWIDRKLRDNPCYKY